MTTDEIQFPYAARSFIINYGDGLVFRNSYLADGKSVTVEHLEGAMKGSLSTSTFNWFELGNGEYILSWQEEDKSTVVHCENFEKKTTRSFYTMMDGSFFELSGKITSETAHV